MRTFLAVWKNDLLRTLPRLAPTLLIVIITLASMLFGIYCSNQTQIRAKIAYIPGDEISLPLPKNPELQITISEKMPPRSDLIRLKYDALVSVGEDGRYQIETLRGDKFRDMILYLLANPEATVADPASDRGVGVNIVGFMMMFFLVNTMSNLFVFSADREQGQIRRVFASPATFRSYLLGHAAYCLSFLIPPFLLLIFLNVIGVRIGFSLAEYAVLMLLMAIVGMSVGFLLYTGIRKADNATMLGNSILILTTVLSGGFGSFSKENRVLDHILDLLPQKSILQFAIHLQNHAFSSGLLFLLYPVLFSLLLLSLSIILLRREYIGRG